MFNDLKNTTAINEIKQMISASNPEISWDDFAIYLTLFSIDSIISQIKALEKLKKHWDTKIKPEKMKSLQSTLKFLENSLKNLKNEYQFEQKMLEENIDLSVETTFNNIQHYDNYKKWSANSLKSILALEEKYDQKIKEYHELNVENDFFSLNQKGKLVSQGYELDKYYASLYLHLEKNGLTPFSKAKLKNLMAKDDEPEEDEDEF